MKKNYNDFLNKLKEIFRGKDDYYLETYDDTDKKIKGKLYGHIGKWFVIVPLLLLVGVILYKAIPAIIKLKMENANVTTEVKKVKNTQMTFSNDEMWKMQSEEKQKKLETDVVEVKNDVKEIKETIKTSIETISSNIDKSIQINKESTENLKSELTNKIENTRQDIENVKTESLVNIEKLKNSNELQVNDATTKLDPNKLVQFNPQKPNNGVNSNEVPSFNLNTKKDDYEYVEIGQGSSSININTLEKKEEDKQIKEFYLSGGFAVATLLTGGNFNTLSDGEKDTIPVTLSIDSKLKAPNNEEMDLRECFVRGAGKADFTSQTAEVTLTNIQCNLLDSKGNHYKISQNIVGWLWDENGEYGAKGRLITKEGEIIAKALPLAFMQTAMEIMTNKSQQTTDRNGVINLSGTGAAFGANASSTIIDKIGDKWLKYMDGLNPKVNLRPGRQLVVQFQGGENLKIEKVTPADIENFKRTFDEGENYEE